ncbi:hypothetical protein ACWA5G_09920 [Xanthomonas axonopodis pv. ricini]
MLTKTELGALRAKMHTAWLRMRARLGFAGLIRTRLLGYEGHRPGQSAHREFADELAFLSLTLHGDNVAEIRFGVRHHRNRHTTGVLLSRWNGTRFAAGAGIRICLHGVSCPLTDLWEEFYHLRYIDLPPIRPRVARTVLTTYHYLPRPGK